MVNTLAFEDLSAEEQRAVTQLKQRMVGHMSSDMFDDLSLFSRFLRARDLNINAAENMLKNHLEWRKTQQIETILTDFSPKEVVAKYFPFSHLGVDKDGAPIIYFHMGAMDSRGILKSCRIADVIKFIIQFLEATVRITLELSLKLGKRIDQWMIIVDFEGFSFAVATHKPTLELMGNLVAVYEGNYPERLKSAYCINGSLYFNMAFSVVKPLLSGPTYKKIKIFGRDGWKDELLKVIDADTLPAFLGGKKTDPDGDPMCKTQLCLGGIVPETYFVKKKERNLSKFPGIQKVTVTRMSKTQLTFNVNEVGFHIEWEFETKSRDIGFALFYKKNVFEKKATELIPNQRIDTNLSSETGMYKCEVPGIYIVEFDNTYSWFHQKEIYYRISIVKDSLEIL